MNSRSTVRSFLIIVFLMILVTGAMAPATEPEASAERPASKGQLLIADRIAFGLLRNFFVDYHSQVDSTPLRVYQLPGFWRAIWIVSAAIVIASSLVSFLVIIRTLRLQMVRKTRELSENERLLSTLMDNLPGMAYRRTNDQSGHMEIVSPGCFPLTGYLPEELRTRPGVRFAELIHPGDYDMVSQAVGGHLAAGQGFRLQYRLRTKAGGEKWVLDQGGGVEGADGKCRFVEGFILDISEYVATQDALQRSREKYRTIFENATEGIFQLDVDGRLLAANRALAEIFGYASPAEMIEAVNAGGEQFLGEALLIELISTIENQSLVSGIEIAHQRRDGIPITIAVKAHGRRDQANTIDRIDGVVEDITTLKQTERLRIERDAAEAASKTKSDFLANIGHEIRTPLNSILGFSQILKAQLKDERLQQYIQAITTSGNTLLRLINDLLDLSKIESGKFELQPTAVDLQRIAREIRLVFMPAVDEKRLEFVVDLDPDLPETLFLDEVRLRQILFNLLKNAFKFTEKGRISLLMRAVDRSQAGVDLEIVVSDTGIGIPPEEQETIFQAFTQRKRQDQSKYAGTGLGLSITRRLVEIIGGEISLYSEVGTGSTFTAVLRNLPVTEGSPGRRLSRENGIRFDEEAVILVIDAVDSNRMVIREFLRSTKLSIVETISIADGIEWCMAIKPDLILLDYTMSFVPDPQLVQRFNRVKEELNIPIVVVTSITEVGSNEFQTNFHFDGWLGKPLLIEDVMQTLARFLPHSTFYRQEDSAFAEKQEGYVLPKAEEVAHSIARLGERLPVLRRILVGNLMEQWKENRETCIVNEMKTFAEEIQRMSVKFELDFLAAWAKVLLNQVRIFDMERLPETFRLFSTLVEMIETCSESGPVTAAGEVNPPCGRNGD